MPSILNATTTNGLVTSADNSGSLQLQTNNGTTAVTIDTSQNVGIGTTSPAARLHVSSPDGTAPLTLNTAGGSDSTRALNFNVAGDNYGKILVPSGSGGAMAFWTGGANAAAERMRITSGGTLCIGRTSGSGVLAVNGDIYIYNTTAGAGNSTLKYNTSTGQVTYDSSARAFKENIEDLEYGLTSVLAMKPRKYVYKTTGVADIGFIADEMLPLVPEITPLADNTINDIGVPNGEPFTVNYDRLTAVLVKAIQELKAELDTVKVELNTLKNPPVEGTE